jgi:addiction module HigA family antidote
MRKPSHPGALMREQLKIPIASAGRRMGVSRAALSATLAGKSSLTADMALRFGRLVGAAPELYLNMQAKLDLWKARRSR